MHEREFNDFAEMQNAWRAMGWRAQYRQLSPGRFHGGLLTSPIGPWSFVRGHWTRGIQHRGEQPRGTVVLATTLFSKGEGRYMGEPLGAHDVIVQAGDQPFELYGGSVWNAAIVQLSEAETAEEIAAITQRDPAAILASPGLARTDPRTSARVRAAFVAYFDTAACQEIPRAMMARDLVSLLVGAVANAKLAAVPGPRASRCREIVRKAEEYASDGEASKLRIPDLCRAVGASERSLHSAFRNLLDISPAAYLKTVRLNRVRAALRDTDPRETLVKQVAYRHGFWHLGQFSRDYRTLFGELPSHTLENDVESSAA